LESTKGSVSHMQSEYQCTNILGNTLFYTGEEDKKANDTFRMS
jgi:hypothetical protein